MLKSALLRRACANRAAQQRAFGTCQASAVAMVAQDTVYGFAENGSGSTTSLSVKDWLRQAPRGVHLLKSVVLLAFRYVTP